jgi:hypothetical protein
MNERSRFSIIKITGNLKIKEIYIAGALLSVLTILFLFFSIRSEGTNGGADDISHYLIARYSFIHSELFLHHWGKPLFTLIASPFAQFGNMGTKIMNLILAILTSFFTFRIVQRLDYKYAWSVIPILFFTPIYTVLSLSGGIEIMAGFLIVLAIYLNLIDKPVWANIVLSFIFFVRNEMFIFLPIFILVNMLKKQYRSIPFLLTGFIVYGIAGWNYYSDFFWFINQIPYRTSTEITGHGEMLSYIKLSKFIFGIPVSILVVLSIGLLIWQILRKNQPIISKKNVNEMILVLGPLLAYFLAHSYVWWKGIGGSGGAVRIMASVAPLAAILALKSISDLTRLLKDRRLHWVLITGLLYLIISAPFRVYKIPVEENNDAILLKSASQWLKSTPYYNHKIFYCDFRLAAYLDIDPFDAKRGKNYLWDPIQPEKGVPDSSIYIWDAHFATNFGETQLDDIMKNPHFKLIQIFKPQENFTVRGGYPYSIYIFQKIPASVNSNQYKQNLEFLNNDSFIYNILAKLDFESNEDQEKTLLSDSAFEGKHSFKTTADMEYGPTLKYTGDQAKVFGGLDLVIKAMVKPLKNAEMNAVFLVGSFENRKKKIGYFKSHFTFENDTLGWYEFKCEFHSPVIRKKSDKAIFYIWNRGRNTFLTDNFEILDKTKPE